MKTVLLCDGCHAVNPSWHHCCNTNSSKFCDLCGSYVSTVNLLDYEIDNYNEKHKNHRRDSGNNALKE